MRKKVVSVERRELWSYKNTIRGQSATMRAAFRHVLECGHVETRSSPCKCITCRTCKLDAAKAAP